MLTRYVVLILLSALSTSGCGVMANSRGWGQDATLAPGWDRLGQAVLNAAIAPSTWAPAAGALAFQIGDADKKVTSWASRKTPVYGSQKNADRISNRLLDAAGGAWLASALFTPSGDDASSWTIAKAKGLGVQEGAGIALRGVVGVIKTETGRRRPNGVGTSSFPSAHASGAALYATLASRNIETMGWSETAVTTSKIALGTLTAATAWARIEANEHYPSDVLAGISLGHFLGAFFTDAFLGLDNERNIAVSIGPLHKGAVVLVGFGF
jgi:hypothetical protein